MSEGGLKTNPESQIQLEGLPEPPRTSFSFEFRKAGLQQTGRFMECGRVGGPIAEIRSPVYAEVPPAVA